MKAILKRKLEKLSSDYEAVTGGSFSHFYCPILLTDDETELCEAHIVNEAFAESDRRSTVQRADVDNFYGSSFEADFEKTQYWRIPPDQIIADSALTNKLRPQILLGREVVGHFLARGPVPNHFTEAITENGVRLGLKIHPNDATVLIRTGCGMRVGQDARLPALVSLLKAAHLTLFDLLGYRYALSCGGRFLGRAVLGEFFLQSQGFGQGGRVKQGRLPFCQVRKYAAATGDSADGGARHSERWLSSRVLPRTPNTLGLHRFHTHVQRHSRRTRSDSRRTERGGPLQRIPMRRGRPILREALPH